MASPEIRHIAILAFLVLAAQLACSTAQAKGRESLGTDGVVGGVILPHDNNGRSALARISGLVLSQVDADEEYVIEAVFPDTEGVGQFLGRLPAGTYELTALTYPSQQGAYGSKQERLELSETGHRLSVLPGALTDLGTWSFILRDRGLFSSITLVWMHEMSGIHRTIARHPDYRSLAISELRGWDRGMDDENRSLVRRLRALSPMAAPLLPTSRGYSLAPTALGDFVLKTADDRWLRIDGPSTGRLNFMIEAEEGGLLAGGDAGLFRGDVSDPASWEEIRVDDSISRIYSGRLVDDFLLLIVEKNELALMPMRGTGSPMHTDTIRSTEVIRLPWPELNRVERVWRKTEKKKGDGPVKASFFDDQALIQYPNDGLKVLSLGRDVSTRSLANVSSFRVQGPHLFVYGQAMRGADSGWHHFHMTLTSEPFSFGPARPVQPPLVLPDGQVLVYGRVLDKDRVRPMAYYISEDAGSSWTEWAADFAVCDGLHPAYFLDGAVYQPCGNGDLYRRELGARDWELQEHNVPIQENPSMELTPDITL